MNPAPAPAIPMFIRQPNFSAIEHDAWRPAVTAAGGGCEVRAPRRPKGTFRAYIAITNACETAPCGQAGPTSLAQHARSSRANRIESGVALAWLIKNDSETMRANWVMTRQNRASMLFSFAVDNLCHTWRFGRGDVSVASDSNRGMAKKLFYAGRVPRVVSAAPVCKVCRL